MHFRARGHPVEREMMHCYADHSLCWSACFRSCEKSIVWSIKECTQLDWKSIGAELVFQRRFTQHQVFTNQSWYVCESPIWLGAEVMAATWSQDQRAKAEGLYRSSQKPLRAKRDERCQIFLVHSRATQSILSMGDEDPNLGCDYGLGAMAWRWWRACSCWRDYNFAKHFALDRQGWRRIYWRMDPFWKSGYQQFRLSSLILREMRLIQAIEFWRKGYWRRGFKISYGYAVMLFSHVALLGEPLPVYFKMTALFDREGIAF